MMKLAKRTMMKPPAILYVIAVALVIIAIVLVYIAIHTYGSYNGYSIPFGMMNVNFSSQMMYNYGMMSGMS